MKVKVVLENGQKVTIKASKATLNDLSIVLSQASITIDGAQYHRNFCARISGVIYRQLRARNVYVQDEEAREVAERMRRSSEWDLNDAQKLCRCAGMEEEFIKASAEEVEEVIYRAAAELDAFIF